MTCRRISLLHVVRLSEVSRLRRVPPSGSGAYHIVREQVPSQRLGCINRICLDPKTDQVWVQILNSDPKTREKHKCYGRKHLLH